ncbi:hypothetical protein [Rhizobium rhizophilum]|uniref:Uncharacterized protein n=1 Tax=Rhizobium rhizophilum TaxID=1850373 RepID=A0ABY2QZG6_9HYPH|nr:hypothetical protein [Rhizobium rhizophilum]THV15775.1 hypothetical protein E9677_10570 [Rhizobium rhizophilum]
MKGSDQFAIGSVNVETLHASRRFLCRYEIAQYCGRVVRKRLGIPDPEWISREAGRSSAIPAGEQHVVSVAGGILQRLLIIEPFNGIAVEKLASGH